MPRNAAHDTILDLCRKYGGLMRNAPEAPMRGYEWATSKRVYRAQEWGAVVLAEADTWEAMLPLVEALPIAGGAW